jgi:DNA-directed RNA polymerase specialized sigma24 family protein
VENDWNRKRIETLLSGDEETQEAFIHDFGPVIYTWMYYQVGADEQIAMELTSQIFGQAIRNISDFNPAEETLFAWLKQQARQTRDEGLGHRQMKPQRPWAWSQLPEDVLCGVSRLRSELLSEKIIDNPFIHEIIQATLAELEQADRELLIHRYNHLDTIENIAEETNSPVEDVQSQLYRSRHSFRRVFFQIISKANSGFSESNATAEIEMLDMNLEKLLSTTTTYQALDETKIDSIRQCMLEAVQETERMRSERPSKKQYLPAAIAAALLILIAGLYLLTRKETIDTAPPVTTEEKTTIAETPTTKAESNDQEKTQSDIDEEELKLIFNLGQRGDVEALLEILKSGQFTSQRIAAVFLGKIADPTAIEPLQEAEEQWYPDSLNDNPFAEAIEQILLRFPDAVADANLIESEPEDTFITEKDSEEKSTTKTPNIAGIISDFSNQPIANIRVELTENLLFSRIKTGRNIASIQTNTKGQFQFPETYEGAVFLTGQGSGQEYVSITHSVWCGKDTICVVNIGGKPALSGTIVIDGAALANQRLFLSATLDISQASFRQEIVTDSNGNFSFLGVQAGIYYLMNRGLDNRIRRLAMIEMPQQETYNTNLNLETVMVSTNYPVEPNFTALTEAFLIYAMDASDDLGQIQGAVEKDGFVLFENVLPGSYVMRIGLDNGVWIQQDVEITDGPEDQVIEMSPIPAEITTLRGRLLNASPVDLFLTNANQQIHINIIPSADGFYELANIPTDVYSLATFVAGQLVEFTQIDLQDQIETTLDIDPAEMLQSFTPLYVVVADETGLILSGSQVWLNREGDIITTSSTGRGAFLAAPSGSYTLSVAHPGYPTQSQDVDLNSSSLLAEPNADNTILIQLGTK